MKDFTESIGFVISFLIAVLLFHMAFGEKPTLLFLILILLGMVYVNVEKFENVARRLSGK